MSKGQFAPQHGNTQSEQSNEATSLGSLSLHYNAKQNSGGEGPENELPQKRAAR